MRKVLRYKNISPSPQALIGFGRFEPGEEFETDREVVNPNFVEVREPKPSKKK